VGLRVLLVNSHGSDKTVGGAERYVARLAEGLRDRGHEVDILAAFPGNFEAAPTTTLGTTDWRTSTTRRIRNHLGDVVSVPTRKLDHVLEAIRPDVVHTNNLPGISTAIWEVARRQGLPVVHSLHDYYLLCPRVTLHDAQGQPGCPQPRFCALRAQRLARWATAVSAVIGVSRYVLERHLHLFSEAQQHVIRHPTTPDETLTLPPPTELRAIGYIGSLEVTKGVNELLAASEQLQQAGYRIHVAGDGRLRPAVEAAAARGTIVYHGVVADGAKQAFFAACDLGVVPSVWSEPGGPPYVVLEWLAAARPVLASTRGGLGERLDDFPGVIPVEPEAEKLVEAVQALARPERWPATVATVRPGGSPGDGERWLREHEAVYLAATSQQDLLR
jgi:glycosyltransferase involved in cell wall biosynthesis